MPRRSTKKERGVFEKDPGSEIWWIRYYIDGRERREKVGRKKDASDLYKIRKADALRGVKLPNNMKSKGVKFEALGKHALEWYIEHGRKDVKNFRIRMNIILKDFGDRVADEILPSEIDAWLKGHDWSPATKNRYKNVFGKTFKIAYADGKVSSNPARLVEQRPEKNARLRFLSADEELRLRDAITKRCPQHMPELDIGLNTGMRKGEQYSLEWSQVSFRRKRILLEETKNGSSREIPMNKSCIAAMEALYENRPHEGRVCQSKYGKDLNDSRSWFDLCIKDAGIQNFTWHCLRHTFISRLVMAGVDLRTAQELAGHKTISMKVRYAHLSGFDLPRQKQYKNEVTEAFASDRLAHLDNPISDVEYLRLDSSRKVIRMFVSVVIDLTKLCPSSAFCPVRKELLRSSEDLDTHLCHCCA